MTDDQKLSAYERYGLPVDGSYGVPELFAIAKRVGVPVRSRATKGELITALNDRLRGHQLPTDDLAGRSGETEALPLVIITVAELPAIFAGRAIRVGTMGGHDVVVRVPSPDELLALSERAGDSLEAQGLPRGPGMTRADAERLCRILEP